MMEKPDDNKNKDKKTSAATGTTKKERAARGASAKPSAAHGAAAKATAPGKSSQVKPAKTPGAAASGAAKPAGKSPPAPLWHEAAAPVSFIGGLLGMLAGTLPASVWVLVFGSVFPPLYLLMPVLIWLGIRFFKGFTGRPGVILTAVFSIAGLYLTLLSTQAADQIIRFRMPVYSLPLVTADMIGRSGMLPSSASAYVFPVIFTVIGLFLSYELQLYAAKRQPAAAQTTGAASKKKKQR